MKADPKTVQRLRTEKGLTQEELAEQAKVGHRTIQRIEQGRGVHPSTYLAVASALGVSTLETPASPISASARRRANEERLSRTASADHAAVDVHVVEIEPPDVSDGPGSPVVHDILVRLEKLGFTTSMGGWSSDRLLALRPAESEDTIYVVYGHDRGVAEKLRDLVEDFELGLRVEILSGACASEASANIPVASILGRHHVLVVYRVAG